jgi:hypothetical protein
MKTLYRSLVALVVVLLLGAPPLAAAYSTALNAVTTGTASAIIPSGGASNIEVYLRSAAGSTSTVTIELCATNAAASCYIVATISNVAAAGAWYAGPSGPYFRVNASAVSAGAVTALYGMNNGTKLETWRDVKVPAVSGAGTLAITDVNATGTVTAATLASTGGITAATTVAATGGVSGTTGTFSGAVSGTTATFSALTTTRVPYASTAGLLIDASTFTFTTSGGILDVTAIRPSGLTVTRVPFAGTAGLLGDVTGFTFGSGALAVPTSVATTRFLSTGTAPTVANVGSNSCGTTAATIVGKDQASVTTVGATSGTECRVTFNVAFANAPVCTASATVATDLHLVTTTANATITGTLTAAEKIYLICLGY